jgi:hypothetical protein
MGLIPLKAQLSYPEYEEQARNLVASLHRKGQLPKDIQELKDLLAPLKAQLSYPKTLQYIKNLIDEQNKLILSIEGVKPLIDKMHIIKKQLEIIRDKLGISKRTNQRNKLQKQIFYLKLNQNRKKSRILSEKINKLKKLYRELQDKEYRFTRSAEFEKQLNKLFPPALEKEIEKIYGEFLRTIGTSLLDKLDSIGEDIDDICESTSVIYEEIKLIKSQSIWHNFESLAIITHDDFPDFTFYII